MKCVVCHGNQIEKKRVNEEIASGNDIVYVPVTTLVCNTCGERYYDRHTMQMLEEMHTKVDNGQADLQEVGRVMTCRE